MSTHSWLRRSSILVALVIGCGSKQSPPPKPTPETTPHAGMCPNMKDTQIAASDDEHGVTVTFTTPGDPTELRLHAHKMATMHDQMSHGGMMGSGMMGSGMMGSGMMGSGMMGSGMKGDGMHAHMMMVPSHAAVDDVDHGARIVLTPDDPAQLAALRDQVHAHVEMMKSGHCPMMDHDAQPAHDAHHDM